MIQGKAMRISSLLVARVSLPVALIVACPAAQAAPLPLPTPALSQPAQILPVRSVLRGLVDFLSDDDTYVHDDHYDWQSYRDSTSRKDRVRDFYQMQQDAQKDYWRHQKDAQKRMIKQQRGW